MSAKKKDAQRQHVSIKKKSRKRVAKSNSRKPPLIGLVQKQKRGK